MICVIFHEMLLFVVRIYVFIECLILKVFTIYLMFDLTWLKLQRTLIVFNFCGSLILDVG